MLVCSNILPISNCDMAQIVILANAMTLKGQGHRSKYMAPSDSFTVNNIDIDTKIVIFKCFVLKGMIKERFLQNG